MAIHGLPDARWGPARRFAGAPRGERPAKTAGGRPRPHSAPGLTLVEVMVVAAIIGVLAALAYPSYIAFRYKGQVAAAVNDMKRLELALYNYNNENGRFPDTLTAAGLAAFRDPWGAPYQYMPITPATAHAVRKDRNLHPINTDFDLYSKGRDGRSVKPLTAHDSQDDVLRARNGDFYGLVSNYY
jgi:general secretion pathway protein G